MDTWNKKVLRRGGGACVVLFVGLWSGFVGLAVSGCRKKDAKIKDLSWVRKEWSRAILHGDCEALYRVLDEKSHWAALSVGRDGKKAAALIAAQYPKEIRGRELAKLDGAQKGAKAWFVHVCRSEKWTATIAKLGGKSKSVDRKGSVAVIHLVSGDKVVFERDRYGRWGSTALRGQLKRHQVKMANVLQMVQENVSQYRRGSMPR
ncbi:MAG: hypothetical protein J7M25_04715 [Deltaproteobacteria bacterium]|nr:hypothetical protein [Deltaproteobacteria bacterium]